MAWGYGGLTLPYRGGGSGTQANLNLINADPFYIQQKGLLDAQSLADASRLGERISQTLIDLGEVPTGFTSTYMPATTAALASQNTAAGLSLLARLNQQAQDARRSSVNDLTARGILSSGETGWQLGRLAEDRKRSEYDMRRDVLNQLAQLQDAFASSELQRKLALVDSAIGAYGRQGSQASNRYYFGGM